jgi:hypothetical protein
LPDLPFQFAVGAITLGLFQFPCGIDLAREQCTGFVVPFGLANFTILEEILPLEFSARIEATAFCLGGGCQTCSGQHQAKGGR